MPLFDTQKRLNEVRCFVRRLVDLTSPNLPPLEGESRLDDRSNRVVPAVVSPWEHGRPIVNEVTYGLTKDLSDRGLSVVLHQPFRSPQAVVGLWLEGPQFALGDVRQNVPLGGGFWQLGVELVDLLDPAEWPDVQSLVSLAAHLVPHCKASAI
jgi:hypothetical protein